MSLDVTLFIPGKDREDYNSFETRHLAVNFAITCKKGYIGSYDAWIKGLAPNWREIANKDNPEYEVPTEEVYDANITHNLGTMASEAGIYEALWRPYQLKPEYVHDDDYKVEMAFEESVTTIASEIIPVLEKGLADLKARPEYFKTFDSPNGWGTYKHFVPFVEKYLNACKKYPDALVSVSR